MLQFIMDQNLLLYLCGAACIWGVVSQFVLRRLYEGLIRETQGAAETQGKFLRQLRQRFQNCIHLNEKVNDISSFTDRNMMDYQFLRMNLHQWERLGREALTVCLLCCGAGLWLLYRSGAAISLETGYSRAAIFSTLLIGLAYGLTDNRYRHQSLKVRLMDYLENSGEIKEYPEIHFSDEEYRKEGDAEAAATDTEAEMISFERKRKTASSEGSRAQRDKRDLKAAVRAKDGAAETAAAQDEKAAEQDKRKSILQQMDPKEKEQILREVLLEFLT